MKKVFALFFLMALVGCQKELSVTQKFVWLKVVKLTTIRYTYAINDFHVIVYSDSLGKRQLIPPSPIFIQADVDGSMENFELTNPDTRILASESLRITRVLYADKNTIFNF